MKSKLVIHIKKRNLMIIDAEMILTNIKIINLLNRKIAND